MKVPPFGKPLKALLEHYQIPTNSVYLYLGKKAWEHGHLSSISRPSRTLILPPDSHPLSYKWPINGCDILMIETSPIDTEFIEDFVVILFSSGATKITLISFDFKLTIYKKDF